VTFLLFITRSFNIAGFVDKAVNRIYLRGCLGDETARPVGPKPEARRTEAGFLRRGGQPPPHQLGGLGSAVNSPSEVRGKAPAENEFGAFPSL